MKFSRVKNFLVGIVAVIIAAVTTYILFAIGLFVLSIVIAIALVAALMIWVTSFFMLQKQGQSIFSHHNVREDTKETTIIDVEFTEVDDKKEDNT